MTVRLSSKYLFPSLNTVVKLSPYCTGSLYAPCWACSILKGVQSTTIRFNRGGHRAIYTSLHHLFTKFICSLSVGGTNTNPNQQEGQKAQSTKIRIKLLIMHLLKLQRSNHRRSRETLLLLYCAIIIIIPVQKCVWVSLFPCEIASASKGQSNIFKNCTTEILLAFCPSLIGRNSR